MFLFVIDVNDYIHDDDDDEIVVDVVDVVANDIVIVVHDGCCRMKMNPRTSEA